MNSFLYAQVYPYTIIIHTTIIGLHSYIERNLTSEVLIHFY